jgi:hypothetical protein
MMVRDPSLVSCGHLVRRRPFASVTSDGCPPSSHPVRLRLGRLLSRWLSRAMSGTRPTPLGTRVDRCSPRLSGMERARDRESCLRKQFSSRHFQWSGDLFDEAEQIGERRQRSSS